MRFVVDMKILWWHIGLAVSFLMASLFPIYASTAPDGLEKVAEEYGFAEKAEDGKVFRPPIPEYMVPGIANKVLAASVAGFLGVVMTLALIRVLGKVLAVKH